MRTVESVIGRELQWIKPRIFKRVYELRTGDIVAARVEWIRILSVRARAESGEGSWIFDRKGIWRPTIDVRLASGEIPIVTFREAGGWKKQSVALEGGREVIMRSNFWRSRFVLETETGEPLAILRQRGFFGLSFDVDLRRRGASFPEFPWLVGLQLYLIVNARQRARAHGG